MGLSSSEQKSTTSQTTTPQAPNWITQPIQDFTSQIGSFAHQDPHSFVAPASPLQQQAFAGAQSLGSEMPAINDAIAMTKAAPGITAPTALTAGQANLTQWQAPQIGNMTHTAPVTLDSAHTIGAESLLNNLDKYINPYTEGVVDSTLANYDANTGRQAAALQAQQARTGAFGGSRAGVAQGQFEADAGLNRGMTEYGLRRDAFNTGAQLSTDDANRRQGASSFNAGAWNTRDLAQGSLNQQRALQDSSMLNQRELEQLGTNARSAEVNAAAANQNSMFNTGQTNSIAQLNNTQSLEAQIAEANRALSAAGQVGTLAQAAGNGARADLGLTADLGAIQHQIQQAYAQAPLAQLQAEGALYGAIPYNAFVGQQMNGTNVTKSTPSLFDMAMQAAATAAKFVPAPG